MLSRPWIRLAVCLVIGLGLLLAAATLPGWRHRHVGTAGHTHRQDHSHAPGHDHGDSHSHAHGHHHSHSHGHSHPHSHNHGHSHSHGHGEHAHSHSMKPGREGWHVHLSFFGFELTLWEPHWDQTETSAMDDESKPNSENGESADEPSGPVFVSNSLVATGWISLFWIDPAPVPTRVKAPATDLSTRAADVHSAFYALRSDAPPVPPPRLV